ESERDRQRESERDRQRERERDRQRERERQTERARDKQLGGKRCERLLWKRERDHQTRLTAHLHIADAHDISSREYLVGLSIHTHYPSPSISPSLSLFLPPSPS